MSLLTLFATPGAWTPASISGLKIWLKADAGAGSSDGDLISSWADQSGGSHHFTTSGSQRPTYRVNVKNGLPVVRFLTDDELAGGNLSALFSTGASVFAAADWVSSSTANHMTLYESGEIDAWWSFSGSGYWGPFRSSRLNNTPSSGLPTTGWHMWSLTADNGSNYKMYLDGVNQINDTGGFTFTPGTQHWLARQHPVGDFMTMDMGELIVYDSALNDTDRGLLETYLYDRWVATAAIGSPSAVAGTGAVPAPTATGTAVALPAAVAGIGAVPAPTAVGGDASTATPGTVAGMGAVPAPTAMGNAAALPAVVAGVGSIPAPTAKGNSTALPSVVAGVGAVPAPTVIVAAIATPARVIGIGAVPAPTVIGGASATAAPASVAVIGRVPFPTTEGEGTGGGGGSVDGANDFWSIVLAS